MLSNFSIFFLLTERYSGVASGPEAVAALFISCKYVVMLHLQNLGFQHNERFNSPSGKAN